MEELVRPIASENTESLMRLLDRDGADLKHISLLQR